MLTPEALAAALREQIARGEFGDAATLLSEQAPQLARWDRAHLQAFKQCLDALAADVVGSRQRIGDRIRTLAAQRRAAGEYRRHAGTAPGRCVR